MRTLNESMAEKADEYQTEGAMKELKGKAREIWGELTDRDLDVPRGNVEQLIGNIQRRTGKSIEYIRQKLFGEEM